MQTEKADSSAIENDGGLNPNGKQLPRLGGGLNTKEKGDLLWAGVVL